MRSTETRVSVRWAIAAAVLPRTAILVTVLFALGANCKATSANCKATSEPLPMPPAPTTADGGAAPAGSCSRACAWKVEHGCVEGGDGGVVTARGATCVAVCENAAREGTDLTCGDGARWWRSCEDARRCR